MSIHANRQGGWEVRWRQGSRNRSRTFDRKSDAAQFQAEVRRLSQLGGIVPQRVGEQTLGDFTEDWLAGKADALAPKTLREYARTLDRHVDSDLGHLPLRDLGPRLLHEWQRDRLNRKAGREAIAKATKLLKQILDQAEAQELIRSNPARTLSTPRSKTRVVVPATPEQIEAMRRQFLAVGQLADAALLSTLSYVGPRPSEALALEPVDLDVDRVSITKALTDGFHKETKTGHPRVCDLPTPVAHDIREWQLSLGRRRGPIWPRAKDGQPWRQHDWDNWRRRRFQPVAREVGLSEFVPYDLRHTAASLMIAAGRPITEVAAQLGHSPQVCAGTYAHLIERLRGREVRPVEYWIRRARHRETQNAAA